MIGRLQVNDSYMVDDRWQTIVDDRYMLDDRGQTIVDDSQMLDDRWQTIVRWQTIDNSSQKNTQMIGR